MEDLLASIRKIIADDVAERPRPAPRVAPPPHRTPPSPPRGEPGTDAELVAMVERSMRDAFAAVDAEDDEPQRSRPGDRGGPERGEDVEAAVHSIAAAIAAERRGRAHRRPRDGDEARRAALGEPDLQSAINAGTPARPAVVTSPADEGVEARGADLRGPPPAIKGGVRTTSTPVLSTRRAPETAAAGPLSARRPDGSGAAVEPRGSRGIDAPGQQTADAVGSVTAARPPERTAPRPDLSRTTLAGAPRTLEDLVSDMLRPLVRDWLEAHLPDIVERQVRLEIARLSARGALTPR